MQDADAIPALEALLNNFSSLPIVRHKAAEAIGAFDLESNIPILKNSLVMDPAPEVRETCELALKRIEEMSSTSKDTSDEPRTTERSPFMSVDPAAPASNCSSVDQSREVLLDEGKSMYDRYAALFAIRNHGVDEAVLAIIDSSSSKSALLKHESCEVALSMLEFKKYGKSFEYLFIEDSLAQA